MTLYDEVQQWAYHGEQGKKYRRLQKKWSFLGVNLFSPYEPTTYSAKSALNFEERLEQWIGNCDIEDDKKALYEMADHIFFVGENEFKSLYRSALNSSIVPWIVDCCNISFRDEKYSNSIKKALKETWICPATDSMKINSFYHVNRISGRDFRPEFQILNKFSSPETVQNFMVENKLKRIVLLEDFSGTGDQMSSSINFAAKLSLNGNPVNILAVPLIAGPGSVEKGRKLAKQFAHIDFRPTLEIPACSLIAKSQAGEDVGWKNAMHGLLERSREKVIGPKPTSREKRLGVYGYAGTGALVVLHTNTPNNSILLIHRSTQTWHALFPRSKR